MLFHAFLGQNELFMIIKLDVASSTVSLAFKILFSFRTSQSVSLNLLLLRSENASLILTVAFQSWLPLHGYV